MSDIEEFETLVNLKLSDLTSFGYEFEYFSDMLADAVRNDLEIDSDKQYLAVTAYGFHSVVDPATVAMTVHFTLEDEE